MTTMTNNDTQVTVGVDTHLDTHVAVALDSIGQILGTGSFRADPQGYRALIAWSEHLGTVRAFGIE